MFYYNWFLLVFFFLGLVQFLAFSFPIIVEKKMGIYFSQYFFLTGLTFTIPLEFWISYCRITNYTPYNIIPNQELSGAKSSLQGETVGVCSFYKRGANHPIIYLRPTFGLQQFFHCLITSNNTTFGLPSYYMEIPQLRIISIHTNYGLPATKSL